MNLLTNLTLMTAVLGYACTTAFAQTSADYTYGVTEVSVKRMRLNHGDEVHVFLTGEAARRYASLSGQEASPDEEVGIGLRCTVEAHLPNGYVRVTSATAFPLYQTEHDENSRMVSFSSNVRVADFGSTQAKGTKTTTPPTIKLKRLDDVKIRAWKLIDEVGT